MMKLIAVLLICQQQLCHLTPGDGEGWHFRTRVGGNPDKCWYVGERMKPRGELYWAETPAVPMLQIDRPPWAQGAKPGWEHKE